MRLRTFALIASLGLAANGAHADDVVVGERGLEARLLAPCCWVQTLDVHESEIAAALRHEIHARLSAGESIAAVEDSLVDRYGDRIRAMPSEAPFMRVMLAALVLVALAGGVVAWRVYRWTERPSAEPMTPTPSRDELDERIDAELRDAP